MVLLGAKGDTAVQISQALCLNTEDGIHQSFQRLLSNLNKPSRKYLLRMVNRLFAEITYEFLPTYKESCLQFYHSELEQLSFAKDPEKSRKHINMWVSKQTKGNIPELLSDDSDVLETRLVLVNTLYFKGRWHEEFETEDTREMPFKISLKEERPVQMMRQEDRFNLAHVNEVQAQVLEMPYEGLELSFVVLLPDDGVDLSQVENGLTFEKLTAWTKPDFMKNTMVEVFLPKFKLQEDYDMKSVFQHLGMVDVFQGGKADLSGMSPETDLCVSKFVHKSVVEVNEGGTEAAASSAGKDRIKRLPGQGRQQSSTLGREALNTVLGDCDIGRLCIMNTLSEANGTFAIHLLKILCQNNPSKNVCYSPVSISSALAMVLLGAKGDTAVQISQTLGLNTEEDIHRGFQCLLNNLNKPDRKYLLRMANRVFAENTCELPPTYKESCLQFYHSELEQLSFAKDPEESRKHINTVVIVSDENTAGINFSSFGNLLTSLINVFYVLGSSVQSEERLVQMMYREDTFNHAYVNEVQAQVLVMPYEGLELSFVVLLPDDGVDLSQVESNLTFEKLTAWTKPDYMKRIYIKVFLPKFKLEEDYKMESVFQHLRMMDVFQGSKAPEKDLCLSKFVHKSVVEVNEEGTEAAAASAIISFYCACIPDLTFRADRPFLFFIRHNETNSLLFCGRFSSP
ncbi:hypothetical protein ACRRTK_018307 [Alexandromys fortis]